MWNKSDTRPDHDCEVFVIAEDLTDGGKICQIDFYNAEEGCSLDCDEENLQLLYWQEIKYPDLPQELRDEEIPVLIHMIYFTKPTLYICQILLYNHPCIAIIRPSESL